MLYLGVLLSLGVCVPMAVGVFLLLSSQTWRKIIGVLVLGNATNVFLVLGGFRHYDTREPNVVLTKLSRAPFVNLNTVDTGLSDPLSQALVLTAIVIGFAVLAIMLAYWLEEISEGKEGQDQT